MACRRMLSRRVGVNVGVRLPRILNARSNVELGISGQLCLGAEAGTRTPTGVLPLRPERSASANSATSARGAAQYT